jgi:formate dehydrogenase subunit gamma
MPRSTRTWLSGWTAVIAISVVLTFAMLAPGAAQNVRPPADAVTSAPPAGRPPGAADPAVRPGNYDIDMWKKLRGGVQGQVSIPDKKAGTLVQSDGESWRNLRNGPLPVYGAYGLAAMLALLAAFFLVRGRIRIDHGWSGQTIERFGNVERMGHWLLATSFIILALTGLNVLYGRYVLLPLIGKEAFASISMLGKMAHNYVAFAFMVSLVMTFVVWVRHNFPSWRDIVWIAKGGGMFKKGVHPAAWKFNAGQKILFWLVMLGGVSLSLSGLALMFPFEFPLFAKTFAALKSVGINVGPAAAAVTPIQEMQYAATWHGIVALVLVAVIFAHIYIGTLGMQGAFSAMGSGQVDVNWAKEHHSLWAERELARKGKPAPAE